ncbi:hypothetical protein ACLKA7_015258 [Drosophila subpalustris]
MICLFPLGRAGWLIGTQGESHPWPAENSTAINKTSHKRIPVPDPGVHALPEMTTYSSSPSSMYICILFYFNSGWQADRQTRNNHEMQHQVAANLNFN